MRHPNHQVGKSPASHDLLVHLQLRECFWKLNGSPVIHQGFRNGPSWSFFFWVGLELTIYCLEWPLGCGTYLACVLLLVLRRSHCKPTWARCKMSSLSDQASWTFTWQQKFEIYDNDQFSLNGFRSCWMLTFLCVPQSISVRSHPRFKFQSMYDSVITVYWHGSLPHIATATFHTFASHLCRWTVRHSIHFNTVYFNSGGCWAQGARSFDTQPFFWRVNNAHIYAYIYTYHNCQCVMCCRCSFIVQFVGSIIGTSFVDRASVAPSLGVFFWGVVIRRGCAQYSESFSFRIGLLLYYRPHF